MSSKVRPRCESLNRSERYLDKSSKRSSRECANDQNRGSIVTTQGMRRTEIDIWFYEFMSQAEGQNYHVVIRDASDTASFDDSFPPSDLRNFYFRSTKFVQVLSNVAHRIDPKVWAELLSKATTITQPNAMNSTKANQTSTPIVGEVNLTCGCLRKWGRDYSEDHCQ